MTAADTFEPSTGIAALRTDRGNLPVDQLDLAAAITGPAVRTELTQGFHNPFAEPLEATYVFPLPDRSAVTSLRMTADGRVVDGVLKERGQARADYARAVEDGRRASIAEEDRPGVFTMRVGNIMPGERVTVRLCLAGLLPYEDGDVTFRFPLVVAPRYIPGTPLPGASVGDGVAVDTDVVPDASRITPPVLLPGFPSPVRFCAVIDVDPAGLPLSAPRCSLPTTEERDGTRLRVLPGQRLDRDLVLRLRLGADDAVTTSLVTRQDADGDGGTFLCTVVPPTVATPARPRDVVLLLDRSGSMAGWKIAAARRAAARIADTLTSADRFAVLAFDHGVETPPDLPAGLVPATDRTKFGAVRYLGGLESRGGTEMWGALERATTLLAGAGADRDRVVVLVTDGQVGDEDRILHSLAPLLGSTRIHAVGVDTAVNGAFLRRLADASGGRCELVESEDRLDDVMAAVHRRIGAPLLTGLFVRGAGIDTATVAPSRLPDVFPGAPVVVSGRYRGDAGVTVGGDVAGTPWHVDLAPIPSDNAGLPAIWARDRVRDLEDRYIAQSTSDIEREIVAVSVKYGVLSRFTAFVAVDSRVVNDGGDRHRVTQPVELPQGWQPPAKPMVAVAGRPARRGRAKVAQNLVMRAPAPAVAATSVSLVPTSVLELATRTLRKLAALAAEPDDARAGFLVDVAAEITRRIEEFRRDGLPEPGIRVLLDVAAAIVLDTDLDARWDRVTLALRPFTESGRPAEFWKR